MAQQQDTEKNSLAIRKVLLNWHTKTKELSVISSKSICAIKSLNILKEAIQVS